MKFAAKQKNIGPLLARAAQLYRLGDRAEAVRLYEQAIVEAPRHAAAHNFLGLAYAQRGEMERAVPLLERAVTLDPSLPSCHYNLGTILQQLKRYDEARKQYEFAIARQPGDSQIHSNLGTVLRAMGRAEQAVDCFRKAVRLNPRFVAAHFNLGNALLELQRHEESHAAFAAALTLEPNFTDAHASAAYALAGLKRYDEALIHFDNAIALKADYPKIHVDRGKVLFLLYRYVDAVASYRRALSLHADLPEAYIGAAGALNRLDRFEEAVDCCERVLARSPDDIEAKASLANSLWGLRKYDEALVLIQQVLAREPDLAPAHFTLAAVLESLDRHEEALESYKTALRSMPDDRLGQLNKGLCDLALGHFAEGWPSFENRWYASSGAPRSFPQPLWGGEPLGGSLLVWAEQGLGDQILFSSMIEDIRAQVPSLRFEVENRLVPLFARSFPRVDVVPIGADPSGEPIAAHVALGSIGRYARPDWAAFKNPPPAYLKADAGRVAGLRDRLAGQGQCVVGLSWGSANPKIGTAKTAMLADFQSVLNIPGCRFVDLQYGDTRAEREALFEEAGINVERLDDVDNLNDIDGLAALISACDIVVTISNTTAHLAGALGKPTWVFLPFGRGRFWYWFWNRDDSPWYPAVRLKRRANGQSWPELISLAAPEIAAATQR